MTHSRSFVPLLLIYFLVIMCYRALRLLPCKEKGAQTYSLSFTGLSTLNHLNRQIDQPCIGVLASTIPQALNYYKSEVSARPSFWL